MNVAPPICKSAPRRESTSDARAEALDRRRELGQFFTPPLVAKFMWDILEISHGGYFSASTQVIDPACGEGVFLLVAAERGIPAKCLFGTDIDEALTPGWRRTPQLRGANVSLVNGLLNQPKSGIVEGAFDVVAGNPPFSGKGLKDLLRLLEEPAAREEMDLFGTGKPRDQLPTMHSLPPSERGELDRLLRALSQYSCWRLNGPLGEEDEVGSESDSAAPELFRGNELNDNRRPTMSDYERAAQLIAQWPKDRLVDTSLPDVRNVIRRITSTSIEVFFTERFLRLTKPGGLIGVIVPESIVAGNRLAPLRLWLAGRMDVYASITLPQKVFSGVGANAKTTILFARRRLREQPVGWDLPQGFRNLPDNGRMIFLAGPRLQAPGWSLESYLSFIRESVRQNRNKLWPEPK